ncbi:MAG TPA: LysR family transcriptional regulator [Paludibaculum sp.]|jgi:DNA-binding transcriptional LysR family regulator
MNVNLKHLEAFAVVARLCSFTRAASQLNISQPALTVQIRQLEETLTVRLLDRNTRSVKLTPAGEELAPVVERLLADISSIVSSAKALSGKVAGIVKVAALPSIAATLLPRIIVAFRKQYPEINVSVRDTAAEQVAAMVLSEEVDLGLGIGEPSHPELAFSPLFQDRMCLVLPTGSPLLENRVIRLNHLTTHPLILPAKGSSVRLLVDNAFAALGLRVAPAYEVTLMSTAAGMVRSGLGAAILPSASLDMGELAGLRQRQLREPALVREIGVLRRSGRALSPAAEGFLEAVSRNPGILALQRAAKRRQS